MNTQSLTDILNSILAFLMSWKFPIDEYLKDGLEKNYIVGNLNEIGIMPTEEMLELYRWKNGTRVVEGTPLDDIQFIPGYHIMSLENSISQYIAIKDDERWNSAWFPFMANGGGDFYAVDLSFKGSFGAPIIGFILGEEDQDIEYQSIRAMMLTFLECCQKGIVFPTKEGYLDMNDDEHALIAKKNNPDVEFWKI